MNENYPRAFFLKIFFKFVVGIYQCIFAYNLVYRSQLINFNLMLNIFCCVGKLHFYNISIDLLQKI